MRPMSSLGTFSKRRNKGSLHFALKSQLVLYGMNIRVTVNTGIGLYNRILSMVPLTFTRQCKVEVSSSF